MDDYVKTHQGLQLFDDEWHKQQKPNDPKLIKELLLGKIPQGGKHDRARKLIDEVCNRNLTSKNFYIARRLWRDRDRSYRSALLTIIAYQKGGFTQKIKNLHKTVRSFIEPAGFTVSYHKQEDTSEISLLK